MNSHRNRQSANPSPGLHPLARALALVLLGGASGLAFGFDSGSTGADGVLNPAVSTEIVLPPSGILQYTSVNIPAGVVVTFKRNVLNTPVQLLVSGNVTIAGTLDLRGQDGKATGTSGDGNQADDGIPGLGGPGGFDGGRGGQDDGQQRPEIVKGGAGLGPGGGRGGYERASGCYGGAHYHYLGLGAAYASRGGAGYGIGYYCGEGDDSELAKKYGNPQILPLIGGSGGGGGSGGPTYPGSGGGGGGGAILIAATGTITVPSGGAIDVTGGDSGDTGGTGSYGRGSGGSGGAIKLMATTVTGSGVLASNGGCTAINGSRRQYCERQTYGASEGRIRIEAENMTFNGTLQPTPSVDLPGPVTVANAPTIRITSIAGSNVPATPTGNADVTLPANVANPVTVNFATANVPTGNTIKLRVVPSAGEIIEVLSPAITGSTASGATSVSVNLPRGPSVLQAITSYSVTVAQAESLSRFAQNERVESVELIAGMGRDSQAYLVTASGKRYAVPAAVLQLAGIAG